MTALPVGNDGGAFYCFFPMPFASSASVQLVDGSGGTAISGIGYALVSRPFTQSFAQVANFHALYTPPGLTVVGTDYTILSYSGSGHYVGVNLELPGVGGALEGNERIYVNGSRSPDIEGTGTEDYFNGGWYFDYGSFNTQTHGAPAVSNQPFTAYRFQLSDVVPFSSSIRVAIQHDSDDSTADAPYGSVAYFYATSRALSQKTDELDIGDPSSVSAHAYAAQGGANAIVLTGTFDSDDPSPLTASGETFSGASSFTVQITSPNDGVVLRRLYDQGASQSAQVSVNGSVVGVWSNPWTSQTFRWAESDFWIPRSVTSGSTSLAVQISPMTGTWTEYEYQALTQLMP